MGFQEAVRTVLSKYIVIEGRARRAEYWYFVLFGLIGGIVLGALDGILFGGTEMTPISSLFSLVLFIPSITVGVRRLHDRDMSGWWMLLMIVPIIGVIALLIIFALRGTDGTNRFGPDPLVDGGDDWSTPDEGNYADSSIPKVDRD